MIRKILFAFLLCLAALPALAQQSVQPVGGTRGGAWAYHYLSTASTNATNVTKNANTVYSIVVFNSNATLYYLKFYDETTTPVCNTDTVVMTVLIPFGTSSSGGGAVIPIPVGMRFNNGIGFCITGAAADSDNSNANTGLILDLLAF